MANSMSHVQENIGVDSAKLHHSSFIFGPAPSLRARCVNVSKAVLACAQETPFIDVSLKGGATRTADCRQFQYIFRPLQGCVLSNALNGSHSTKVA